MWAYTHRGAVYFDKSEHGNELPEPLPYALVYAVGAIAYPAFKINTRVRLFDEHIPWATGLFEVKEHWGALGLAFFVVYYLLRRNFDPDEEREKLWFYVPLCLLLNLILWYKVIVGCYVALLKGGVA